MRAEYSTRIVKEHTCFAGASSTIFTTVEDNHNETPKTSRSAGGATKIAV